MVVTGTAVFTLALPSPAAPSSPSRLGASLRSPRPAAGRRTLLCFVHQSAPMSALRSGVGGRASPPVEMPASLSWNPWGRGIPHPPQHPRPTWAWCPGTGGPGGLVLGVTHPGFQPVAVEPKLVPLLLHLLKLVPQLLDLLLGRSKEGKVSQSCCGRPEAWNPHPWGEGSWGSWTRTQGLGSHCLPGVPIPTPLPRC